ncbi:MAG: hypothetical protein IPO92_05755 [Saprospiraceae bacterium]|nr:hypothetical protein [Saprospiraceae bacterium]
MQPIKKFQNSIENLPAYIARAMMVTFLLAYTHLFIHAQATLSLQGILKKANGIALEDGDYPITFKVYVVDSTQVKWMETIPDVEVISGIYSVILGQITPINLPFDKDYELGISIGSQEMKPRVRLTSAPYALALRGSSNQFPSAGLVLADEIKVAQGVLASGGAPGVNGVDKNGYAFTGNNGDNDSGLFSTQDGEVSLYVNNVEKIEVNSTGATVLGTLGTNQVNINNNGGINYTSTQGSFQDWRLAYVDDLSMNADGWQVYNPCCSQTFGWNNPTPAGPASRNNYSPLVGWVVEQAAVAQVLKKQYTIAGTYSEIKVRFRYYAFGSWEGWQGDAGFAGFATSASAANFRIGWNIPLSYPTSLQGLTNTAFGDATKIKTTNGASGDQSVDVEMTAMANGNSFWLIVGFASNHGTIADESFGISRVEVYVK